MSANKLPVRKPNRLKNYNYGTNGKYFLTICAKDRLELFSTIDVGAAFCRPRYTNIGRIIEKEITVLSRSYDGVSVECFVIIPNHVHMIISIERMDGGRQDAAPTATISQMMNQWKRAVSMKVGYSVWQKSFHDHVIRDEHDYKKIAEYIENNPYVWTEDRFYPK